MSEGSRPSGWAPAGSVGVTVPSTGPGKKLCRDTPNGVGERCGMGCGDSHMLRAAHSDSPLRSPFPFGAAEAASWPAPATPAELKKARRDMPATPLRGRMSFRFILSSLRAKGLKFVVSCRKHALDVGWTLASGTIGANAGKRPLRLPAIASLEMA